MKKIFLWVLALVCLVAVSCLHKPGNDPGNGGEPAPQENKTVLKILAIGNSFTDDATEYIPPLLEAAKLPNVVIARAVSSGSSLSDHESNYRYNTAAYKFTVRDGKKWKTISESSTLSMAVKSDQWDIVVLQQVSQHSGQYNTYQPFLDELLGMIRSDCTNKSRSFAWQMTWAYGSNSTHSGFAYYNNSQQQMYSDIVQATKEMSQATGISLIIPSGTAIRNLRHSTLNNPPADLTRDGYHIDYGAGRYTLACTWFQALVTPKTGVGVTGNGFRVVNLGERPVTEENYSICQSAAVQACANKYPEN